MREKLARLLAAFTGVLIVVVAFGFAALQNLRRATESASPSDPALVAAGRAVYEAQGCALCHAVAGEGDASNPLDQVGARLGPEQLHLSFAPDESMRGRFPSEIYEAKQAFRSLPKADTDALVAYLQSLR